MISYGKLEWIVILYRGDGTFQYKEDNRNEMQRCILDKLKSRLTVAKGMSKIHLLMVVLVIRW